MNQRWSWSITPSLSVSYRRVVEAERRQRAEAAPGLEDLHFGTGLEAVALRRPRPTVQLVVVALLEVDVVVVVLAVHVVLVVVVDVKVVTAKKRAETSSFLNKNRLGSSQ